jgi:cytochrome P450
VGQVESRSPLFDLDEQLVRCPFTYYKQLHDEPAVVWVPQIEAFFVARYKDVVEVLRDTERFSNREVAGPINMRQAVEAVNLLAEKDPELSAMVQEVLVSAAGALVYADPPEHTHQRAVINRVFTSRQVSALEGLIRELCQRLLDEVADEDQVDFIDRYTAPIPLQVITGMLGVPESDFEQFKHWTDMRVSGIGNDNLSPDELREKMQAEVDEYNYFKRLVLERRDSPANDLISRLANVVDGGERLGVAEACGVIAVLLVAGNETVRHLLGSSLRILATDRQLFDRLAQQREEIPTFIEEVLRLNSPVQGLYRTATRDTELSGTRIPAGSALYVAYGAANYDASEFPCPADLTTSRTNVHSHVAFGYGPHICLGAALARLEARVALNAVFDRYQAVDLVDEDRVSSYSIRGLEHLWLRVQRVDDALSRRASSTRA